MPENSIRLWSEVDKSEFDFKKYYVNALQKMNSLNSDEIYHKMEELKFRMSHFITLDAFKFADFSASTDANDKLISSMGLTYLITKKVRAGMIKDAMTMPHDLWRGIDMNDAENFSNEIALFSLEYSTILGEQSAPVKRAVLGLV